MSIMKFHKFKIYKKKKKSIYLIITSTYHIVRQRLLKHHHFNHRSHNLNTVKRNFYTKTTQGTKYTFMCMTTSTSIWDQ